MEIFKSAIIEFEREGIEFATDDSSRFSASIDNSRYSSLPDVVVYARNEMEVSKVAKIASKYSIALTTRGAGSGCSGAAIPLRGGIVLDMSKIDFIEINPIARAARVGAGAITAKIDAEASKFGLMYAPDPSSHKYSTIGGNIAHNAGGLRAAKYGNTRDNLLSLKAVLANGDVVKCGLPLRKFSAGLNLRDLIVGSEGTLAIVTEAWLKLLPKPESKKVGLAFFDGDAKAFEGIEKMLLSPLQPSIFEFMDSDTLACVAKRDSSLNIPQGAAAILAEFDGTKAEADYSIQKFLEIFSSCAVARTAKSEDEAQALWKVRRTASPAMYDLGDSKVGQDIVLPFDAVVGYFSFFKNLACEYNLPAPVFGHAADGNYHIHFMYNESDGSRERALDAMSKAVEKVVDFGGAISGEHGIGFLKSKYMLLQHGDAELSAMRSIKKALDPQDILNPDKLYAPNDISSLKPLRGVKLAWD